MADYYSEVRTNLQAAYDKKAAERREEARKTRYAKITIVCILITVAALIALFGNHVVNWC